MSSIKTSRGGLNPTNSPSHFPSSFSSLQKKTQPEVQVKEAGAVGTDTYSKGYEVGNVEAFTIYGKGSGDWNIQVAPTGNADMWVDYLGTDKTGNGFISVTDPHQLMRVVARNGSNVEIWLYRKYSTY